MSTSFFVPPSIRAASQAKQFSASRSGADPPQARKPSLLARLLGLDRDVGAFSSAESTLPLREVARFPFPVMVMDVAVQPKDRIPRAVLSDAEHIYMYKIVGEKFEPVWTLPMRGLGRIFWLQLVDLDGDGVFEVVGNRFHHEAGLGGLILAGVTTPDPPPHISTFEQWLGHGLSSYPHPRLMPRFWEFPTVSMGLASASFSGM